MAEIGLRRSVFDKRRRGSKALLRVWLRRFGVVVIIWISCVWLCAWFFLSDADIKTQDWVEKQILNATAGMGFKVENILVEGRVYADAEILKALINIEKGDPLFSLDPNKAKALIEQVSWVRSARVERRFPNTIYVGIQERKPSALWQNGKGVSVLDEEGKIITSEKLERFKNLIMVKGEKAAEQTPFLLEMLKAEPEIYNRALKAEWVGDRRWDLVLDSGLVIKLPEQDIGLALSTLAKAQEEDKILERDIQSIDVREPGKLTIRTRPGGIQDYQSGLKTEGQI